MKIQMVLVPDQRMQYVKRKGERKKGLDTSIL
jgi:hypothetical protein